MVGAQGARYKGRISYSLKNARKNIFEIMLTLY